MLFILVFLMAIASAQIEVGFPFNEQLPNVARIDTAYSFTMANITYKSDNFGVISYQATGLPSWLSFDSDSRTFTGTPSKDDVQEFEIHLFGTDSSDGSTINNTYSMIVSNDTGLHLSSNDVMFTEIAKYGDTNGNDGLVVREGQEFNISFEKSVFESYSTSKRPIVAYYGRSADRSSLPNWIDFDSDSLTFSGIVPHVVSDIAPSFEYGFSFIGSDYVGFAGAEGIFKLIVGAHSLSTSLNESIKVNGTLNHDFDISIPIFSSVFLDGSLISAENISSVDSTDLPSWIHLDTDHYTLTGNFPGDATFDNFTINVKDVFQNEVELPYSFNAIGSVFTLSTLPNVNATRGQFFEYHLMNSYFTDFNSTDVSVKFDSSNSWLTFHEDNNTFTGQVPKDLQKINVDVSASSDYDSEDKSFDIVGIDSKTSSTSSSSSATATSSSSSSPTSSPSSSSTPVKSKASTNHKALAIGLGVGIPAFLLLVAALILFCCCIKRRKERKQDPRKDMEKDAAVPELTGPGFGNTYDNDSQKGRKLAAANARKLDNTKPYDYDDDIHSTSSSITHVESNGSAARYVDAIELPVKSWRARDNSDDKQNRNSEVSLSTVNTEQLFSVRLVDDQSARNSQQSSFVARQLLSSTSLHEVMRRDSSTNLQRLDSDGNIVDSATSSNASTPSPWKTVPKSGSILAILPEENSREYTNSVRNATDTSTVYLSADHSTNSNNSNSHTSRHDFSESSISNLLSKFNESPSGSERDLSQYQHEDSAYLDEFKAVKTSNGDFQWSSDRTDRSSEDNTDLMHKTASNFNLSHDDLAIATKTLPMRHSNLSTISIESGNSDQMLLNHDGSPQIPKRSRSRTSKAKLVNFTRKGSLRESSYEPDIKFHEESAQVHSNDSD
ncbi:polarity establishment/cellular polarization [Scheffersomyces stipitis CBS 6054]|uniref:Polarity establishment/cellular polarization n=1 Tax=Scheffersomyces stipitis (strain ATCC 58785 / CBS 6054 / NBRC 10063 / NRRL Y-11545) TaxID=322104 RepID=A3LYM4_PICST|nr:polarity establishment/cellular polarization [Scheffersomyces stipitis CBS 6054]ABN68197.2 polarity establishment/cellular polarization [Scheffersomyces stipitis CBS 6054]KAG2731372.1 hypothetical protein G9P44_005788 [Scheffersomyces stipitis]